MNDRATSCGAFFNKGLLWATCLLLLTHIPASASLLSAGVDLGAAGRTQDWAVFTLGGGGCGNNRSELSGSASVEGDVAVAGSATLSLNGHSTIHGDLSLHNFGSLDVSRNAEIFGGTYFNTATKAILNQGVIDAGTASRAAFSLSSTAGFPREISTNRSLTLNGSGVVVLKLSDFNLSGHASLTLRGNAATTFIINVKDDFSLSGSSIVQLTGGLTWDNVLFNVRGKGLVSLSGSSQLEGIILATDRTVKLSGQSQVRGEIIASNVVLSGNSVVSRPPTVSP